MATFYTDDTWTRIVITLFHRTQLESFFQHWNKYDWLSFLFITIALVRTMVIVMLRVGFGKPKVCKVPKVFKQPVPVPILGMSLHLLWNRNDLPSYLSKLVAKHGSSLHSKIFGKHFVILNDPAMIQAVLMSNVPGHIKKPDFFYRVAFTDALANGLVSSEPKIWKDHRNILSKAFTYEALKKYVPIICQHSYKLVMEFDEHSMSKEKMTDFTFLNKFGLSLFGTTSHIVTGTDIVTDKECSTFYQNIHRCQEIAAYRIHRPWLLSNLIWNLHPLKKELDSCVKNVDRDIRHLFKRQKEQDSLSNTCEKSFKSMMDVMMAAEMPDEEILVEMTTLLIAGHDTTSVSMNFLMANLALHVEHQRECREEVDKMFDILSTNGESATNNITIEGLSELKYVERCIKESLRMYPTIPLSCRELDSPLKLGNDLEIGSGVIVVLSPWMLHRSPEFYPDPDKFDPDRFLPENCKSRSNFAYIPFLSGPRNCIGWKMAMLEIKILTAYILRNFEIHTNDTAENLEHLRFNIVLATEKKINVVLKRRHYTK